MRRSPGVDAMGIRLDGYTVTGVLHAEVDAVARLSDALEAEAALRLEHGQLVRLDGSGAQDVRGMTLGLDDLCLAVAAPDTDVPGHLAWHDLRLLVGPWVVRGAMPTMPGFDPGRALARPQGAFVLLRDVSIGLAAVPAAADRVPYGWVNRYVVEQVEADLDLLFFFPGAERVPAPDVTASTA